MNEQFKQDVLEGLSKTPQKALPSKYFYDERGDELFQQIMTLPEYYLTRAELEIFQTKAPELIAALQKDKAEPFEIVELGAGDGTKTVELLKVLLAEGYQFEYVPVDISPHALDVLQTRLNATLPALRVRPQANEYFAALHELKHNGVPKVVFFLGSNLGNLSDEQATILLCQLCANLARGDRVLLGLDLIKPKEVVLPAYDDAQGVTQEFNLNLLDRINRELGANFDRQQYVHAPYYEEREGIAKSYLRSKVKQSVTIKALKKTFHFEADELIHTEISCKYNDDILHRLLARTSFTIEAKVTDSNAFFADYILRRN